MRFLRLALMILAVSASCARKTLVAPAPAASPQTAPTRVQETTTLTVPVEVQVAYLERLMNQSLGQSLYEDNSLDDNGGDNLMLRVTKRQPIKLSATGNVVEILVPISVWAKVGYRVDKFGLSVGKYEDTDFDVDVRFATRIGLTQDWKLQTTTSSNGYQWVKKPTVHLIGFDIPITTLVEKVLDREQPNIAKAIDQAVAKNFDLKDEVTRVWRLMQEPILVNETYHAWLKLKPQRALLVGPTASGGKFKATIGITALAETVLGEKPVVATDPTLPPLELATQAPEKFDVVLTSRVPWAEARRLAMEQIGPQTFTFQNGKKQVKITDLDMYGQDGRMVIGVTLIGSLTGKVYLKGTPVYDPANQTVSLTNLDYDLETRNRLARAADWMMHGQLLKKMEPYFTVSVASQLQEGRQLLRQNLAGNRIREDITVDGVLDRMDPEAIYATAEGLEVLVRASGRLSVRVE